MSRSSIMAATTSPERQRMSDVARVAGVSPMTVSRALRKPEKVAATTRARVAAAVAELDYVPDLAAGGLAARRSRLIGMIVSTLESSIFAATVQGLDGVVRAEGYTVLLGSSEYSGESEEELVRALLGRRPDGIVLTGSVRGTAARRLLRAAAIPVVETWELPRVPLDLAVGFSNLAAGEAMTRALHADGYRRIAFIGTSARDDHRGRRRYLGYVAALEALDAGPPRLVRLPSTVAGVADGETAWELLQRAYPDADAAFCVADGVAAGLILACRRRGIPVPQRLAVAGFGDFELARPAALDITTVRVGGREIGSRAGQLLMARLRGDEIGPRVEDLGFAIVRRGTS